MRSSRSSVPFSLLVVLCLFRVCATGEDFTALASRFIESRKALYAECHAVLDITYRPGASPRRIEVWCKGEKLRNDFIDCDPLADGNYPFCVIVGDEYIQQREGEDAITLGSVDLPAGRPQSKVVHPGLIGGCHGGLASGLFGSAEWIVDDLAFKRTKEPEIGFDYRLVDSAHCFNLVEALQVPKRYKVEELDGYSSFRDFLVDHPDREVSQVDVSTQVEFSAGASFDLLKFERTQQYEGSSEKTTILLQNTHSAVAGSDIPVISRSQWTAMFGDTIHEYMQVDVLSIDFGPVDDLLFTLPRLSRTPGVVILDRRGSSDKHTNGRLIDGKVVFADPTGVRKGFDGPKQSRARAIRLRWLAVNVVVISVILCFVAARRSKVGK